MENIAIERISVFGLPPVAFVQLAAELHCPYITTALRSMDYNPHDYPRYSLKDDLGLRRELIAAMRDCGVSLSLGEGFGIWPDSDVRDAYGADLEVMGELGIKRISAVSLDTDMKRSFDQLGKLAEMAAAVGMDTVLEFVPTFAIADLPAAVAAIRHVGRRDFQLLIDTMHVARSGARAADIEALDPDMIGYVQLCDAPLVPKIPSYLEEAMFERMVPGTGELPLLDILRALPRNRIIGLEVPLRSEAQAGVGPKDRLGRCVEAARSLLTQLERE